jgi:hypothetical protein
MTTQKTVEEQAKELYNKRLEDRGVQGAEGSEVIDRKGATTEQEFLKKYGAAETNGEAAE